MEIQELNIRVPGMSREQGAGLGQQVAERIAAMIPLDTADHYLPEVNIQWNGAMPPDMDTLSNGIAEQIVSQIKLLTLSK